LAALLGFARTRSHTQGGPAGIRRPDRLRNRYSASDCFSRSISRR
jgi:hypothetical protein